MPVSGHNISRATKITQVAAYAAAATTARSSTAVDMQGYDAVTFIQAQIDTARVVTVSGSDTAATATDFVAYTTPTVTTTATGQTAVLEVNRPNKRYLKLDVAAGTSSVLGNCIAIRSAARELPVTNENAAADGVKWALAATPTT